MLSAAVRISQPSLSHAIAQLEQELGVPLFEKNGRNVELTQFGEVFLKQVRQSLEILDGSVDYLHRIAAGNGGVRLGLLRALGVEYVPALAAGFQRQNADKNVDFTFFTGVTLDIMHKLQRHELDIVLSSKPAETYQAADSKSRHGIGIKPFQILYCVFHINLVAFQCIYHAVPKNIRIIVVHFQVRHTIS